MLKLAVIGKDVSKSTSPQMHKFIASELGFEITYEKISVPEERFDEEIKTLLKEYDG
ncbi:MAG: shikimate dehydrogenase, partial [Clostridia bacterium]|nr:shikimate dehydrogenase [Clostridia bacterium]